MKTLFRTTSDNRKVWVSGAVVINETLHQVKAGYIKCDPGLNRMAWGTTKEKSKCPLCFPVINIQLEIF